MADNSGASGNARPLTILIWIAVFAILIVGGYHLFNPHRSHDQQVLINKAK